MVRPFSEATVPIEAPPLAPTAAGNRVLAALRPERPGGAPADAEVPVAAVDEPPICPFSTRTPT